MTQEHDDQQLTAYALGELSDKERAEVEKRLATDPEAQQAVAEVREVARVLGDELKGEAAPKLTAAQRHDVETRARQSHRGPLILRIGRRLSVAAALLVVCGVFVYTLLPSLIRSRELSEEVAHRARSYSLMLQSQVSEGRSAPSVSLPDDWNREAYDYIAENVFKAVQDHPLSTFSIDVDTASYANVRRMLTEGVWPPKGAIRIEEMVNYFRYAYAGPPEDGEHPFAAHMVVAQCPWQPKHRLVRIGIKGREIALEQRPAANLVFLLDVSGSMSPRNKLPLVKRAMRMLVEQLTETDRVAIVVYAGAAGLVLDSTPCDHKDAVLEALGRLHAGGSTNGGEGIRLAYRVAREHFIRDGVNRVILCTDGDFNVGTTSESDLVDLIQEKARSGVFLSALGFGMGNYQDSRLEKLADKGNGNYAYIDTIHEARKVLVEQASGTLVTIAKDVKIQVEFNPSRVSAWRLVGYENRVLADEDFNDDTKDAGEIGAGHTVTALYELVPADVDVAIPGVDPLKYRKPADLSDAAESDELLTLKLRYKRPDGNTSILMTNVLRDQDVSFETADEDFRFAAAVAAFGMILRDSQYVGEYTLEAVETLARSALGNDADGYRAEFLRLVRTAQALPHGG